MLGDLNRFQKSVAYDPMRIPCSFSHRKLSDTGVIFDLGPTKRQNYPPCQTSMPRVLDRYSGEKPMSIAIPPSACLGFPVHALQNQEMDPP